jgi:cyclase
MATDVVIVPTGTANLASVRAAFERLGARPRVEADPEIIRSAPFVVLPGVGAFGPVARRLEGSDTARALRARLEQGDPTLAICLGLQLLAEGSEEAPGVPGLGILPGFVRSLPPEVAVPHLGWNLVEPERPGPLSAGWAYFANSFALDRVPDGWDGAWFHHGKGMVAALWRGRVLACQFHPELSGEWGTALLRDWLEGTPSSLQESPNRGSGLAPRVIPCLDLDGGRVVKGVRFSGLRDAGDPVRLAADYELQGADELVLLDVSATPEGRANRRDVVAAVRARVKLPLTVGGGIRSVEDAAVLLEAGADRVAVNTAAVSRPELIGELASAFGRQCVVLALDAAARDGGWEVVVRSGRDRPGLDAVVWARQAEAAGAGEILLTSWDRDGTQAGYGLDLIDAVSSSVRIPVIASGGARVASDMAEALKAGAAAVLAASILHDGDTSVAALKRELVGVGVEVRR